MLRGNLGSAARARLGLTSSVSHHSDERLQSPFDYQEARMSTTECFSHTSGLNTYKRVTAGSLTASLALSRTAAVASQAVSGQFRGCLVL